MVLFPLIELHTAKLTNLFPLGYIETAERLQHEAGSVISKVNRINFLQYGNISFPDVLLIKLV